jgi:TonB family protein
MSDTALLNLGAWWLQAGALALAAAALAHVVRVDAPRARYAWWRVVLIACLALPVLQPWQPAAVMPLDGPSVARPAVEAAAPVSEVRAVPARMPPPSPAPVEWSLIATPILIGGALLRLAWIAAGLVRLRRVRRQGIETRLSESGQDLVQALHDAGADVRLVPALEQPVTFGVRNPVVLLPARLEVMPAGVQRAVLVHELWHVRRRDWLWSLCEEALRAILWFHPAIWYLVSQIQSAREEVVDELSIRSLNARRGYLEALLAFADAPAAYPAAPFIRRRQLFHRMMLITREGVMSSKRIVASCAGMAGALLLVGWYAGSTFPLTADATMLPPVVDEQPPRDPRPAATPSSLARESELADATATDPSNVKTWLELAKLQEQRGAVADAERTLRSALTATAGSREAARGLATFFYRQGDFENTMAVLEDLAARNPTDASGHQLVAAYYEEKARKDHSLTPGDRLHYIDAGIRATDRALAQEPDYVAALTYKTILLRARGALETDQTRRQTLIAQANTLHNRASELSRARRPAPPPAGAPPPPPPPPRPSQHYVIDGQRAVRVGGDIAAPAKIHHVAPIYPHAAQNAGVGGSVDIEIAVDTKGAVRSTFFKRSKPALDQAALDAVRQWRFEPTVVDGAAVPVLMMVTVDVGPDR